MYIQTYPKCPKAEKKNRMGLQAFKSSEIQLHGSPFFVFCGDENRCLGLGQCFFGWVETGNQRMCYVLSLEYATIRNSSFWWFVHCVSMFELSIYYFDWCSVHQILLGYILYLLVINIPPCWGLGHPRYRHQQCCWSTTDTWNFIGKAFFGKAKTLGLFWADQVSNRILVDEILNVTWVVLKQLKHQPNHTQFASFVPNLKAKCH